VPPDRARAFAPGRVNLIGEHTDYNGGLALPFAISRGIVVDGVACDDLVVRAHAVDLGERYAFAVSQRMRAPGWRNFVIGMVAELSALDVSVGGAQLEIGGDLPSGVGLSSSAALEVALCLALLAISRVDANEIGWLELARTCARVENEWVGAQTGLLDQIASLCGEPEAALLIDFATVQLETVPLRLDGWRLVVLDSGQRHEHADGGYNDRRAECAPAAELLGVSALSEADADAAARLPEPLARRARHVLSENARVTAAVDAIERGDAADLGRLLSASHASLRDDFAVSLPAIDRIVDAAQHDPAVFGARITGGGFGGSVLVLARTGSARAAAERAVASSSGRVALPAR